MSKSLILARNSASEEARMRLEKFDSPWTAERLKEFFKAYAKDRQIFVVSNREPYIHKKNKNNIIGKFQPAEWLLLLSRLWRPAAVLGWRMVAVMLINRR